MALNKTRIVRVVFHEPYAGQREFFFGSIKAVFEMFNAEQVGRSYIYLKSYMRGSTHYDTGRCWIDRIPVYRLEAKKRGSRVVDSE